MDLQKCYMIIQRITKIITMKDITRAYYSKLQQRFVTRDEYFDDLLFGALKQDDYKQNTITNR